MIRSRLLGGHGRLPDHRLLDAERLDLAQLLHLPLVVLGGLRGLLLLRLQLLLDCVDLGFLLEPLGLEPQLRHRLQVLDAQLLKPLGLHAAGVAQLAHHGVHFVVARVLPLDGGGYCAAAGGKVRRGQGSPAERLLLESRGGGDLVQSEQLLLQFLVLLLERGRLRKGDS